LHFTTDERVLDGSFEFEPLLIVKDKDGMVIAQQEYNIFGRIETVTLNKNSGLGSRVSDEIDEKR